MLEKMRLSWALGLWRGLQQGAGPHAAGAATIDVDSAWMLDEWQRELLERLLYQARGGSVRFVESTSGGGRSHFLQLFEGRAARSGFVLARLRQERQSEYWRDPLALYREIAAGLMAPRSTPSPGLPALAASRSEEMAREGLYPELPVWGRALELWVATRDLAAERYLLGESPGSEGEPLGLHAGLDPRQAPLALRCLLNYLLYLGEKGLVVLGDGAGSVEESEERATLESLRNLIDSCAAGGLPGLLLVFGVLPGFRQSLLPEYEALRQRLHNGFSLGPAGCLRPILVLEEQRRWRASRGVDFPTELFERLREVSGGLDPRLLEGSAALRRNAEALLAELPWQADSPGAARGLTRTIARWLSHPELALDSSEDEQRASQLGEFLESEAL